MMSDSERTLVIILFLIALLPAAIALSAAAVLVSPWFGIPALALAVGLGGLMGVVDALG